MILKIKKAFVIAEVGQNRQGILTMPSNTLIPFLQLELML